MSSHISFARHVAQLGDQLLAVERPEHDVEYPGSGHLLSGIATENPTRPRPRTSWDIETLRAREDALREFPGNTFAISYDRWFLDRIATHILAFEGDSHVEFFQGNYREYETDKKRRLGDDAGPTRLRYKALK